jgi:competence protein ComEC
MKDLLGREAVAVLLGGWLAMNSGQEVRIWILAFFVLLLARLYLFWQPSHFWPRLRKPEILLLGAAILIGFFYGMTGERDLQSPLVITKIEVEGVLQDWTVDAAGGRGVILIQANSQQRKDLDQRYSLRVFADRQGVIGREWGSLQPGDRIRFAGKLERPKGPGTAGEFDKPLSNAVRGLSGSVTAGGDAVVLEKGVPGIPWKIRQKVGEALNRYWPDQAGVMAGILFGDSEGIDAQTLEMYKAAGVMHVFAASGANVAFIISLFWGIFFFLPPKVRIMATIGIVLIYTVLCQGTPPILRAAILGTAVLLGRMGKGKMSALRWLTLAALGLFIFQPLYVKDVSFELSFAAAWGMIVLTPRLQKLRYWQKIPEFLRTPAAMAASTQIATLPVLIDVFHRISLMGFVTNVFMLFILGAVLQFGLLGTVSLPVPFVSFTFFQAGFWLLQLAEAVLSRLAGLPFAYDWVLNPGKLFWLLWYAGLGVWLFGKDKVWFILGVQLRKLQIRLAAKGIKIKVKISAKAVALGLAWAVFLFTIRPSGDGLMVTFLDVGQGDCILIQTASENILVDTGPRSEGYDTGERILVPYLMEKGIKNLDLVFITHEDLDHIGGAKYLVANIAPQTVGIPEVGDRLLSEAWQEGMLAYLNRNQLLRLTAGETLTFSSGLKVEVLAPVSIISGTAADSNNNSLVLLFHYRDWKILLTGDMEKEEMQQIADRGADWDADFIKIPHHGSKGSLEPSWFDPLSPLAVFISVGKNTFGHPSPEVLDYWGERGVPVYRTDLNGTIELKINDGSFQILPGRP